MTAPQKECHWLEIDISVKHADVQILIWKAPCDEVPAGKFATEYDATKDAVMRLRQIGQQCLREAEGLMKKFSK